MNSTPVLETISRLAAAVSEQKASRTNLTSLLEILAAGREDAVIFLLLHEAATDLLRPVASFGLGPHSFRVLEQRAERTPMRGVFDTGESVFIDDASAIASLDFLNTDGRKISLNAIPVKVGKRELGVLTADLPEGSDREESESMLRIAAAMIAQTIAAESATAADRQKLEEENTYLRHELKDKYDFSHLVGNSNAMKQVYEQVSQVARSNATVLLRGESGTGKEMIANALHYNSLRSKRPFVKINCAALPDTLIESELFGYEKGAFTGAERTKKGTI